MNSLAISKSGGSMLPEPSNTKAISVPGSLISKDRTTYKQRHLYFAISEILWVYYIGQTDWKIATNPFISGFTTAMGNY